MSEAVLLYRMAVRCTFLGMGGYVVRTGTWHHSRRVLISRLNQTTDTRVSLTKTNNKFIVVEIR